MQGKESQGDGDGSGGTGPVPVQVFPLVRDTELIFSQSNFTTVEESEMEKVSFKMFCYTLKRTPSPVLGCLSLEFFLCREGFVTDGDSKRPWFIHSK